MKKKGTIVMAFLDKVSRTFSETGQKAKDFADIAKLNGKISENNNRIKQLYLEIGEQYCRIHISDPEPELAERVASVVRLEAQNEAWMEEIQTLRNLIKCPDCGAYAAKNAPFCTSCGRRLLPETAVICPKCGAVAEMGMSFCQHCGTHLPDGQTQLSDSEESAPKVRCQCGAELEEGALFCSNCGLRQEWQANPGQQRNDFEEEAASTVGQEPPGVPREQPSWCVNCGTVLEPGAVFCSECGARRQL